MREQIVSVLFADPRGVYSTLPNIDLWPESLDARKYDGVGPIVAHPPCQLWGRFAHVNFKRWGGEHNRPGNDSGCFASALNSVIRFGGVLEHPAFSDAWKAHGLVAPRVSGWIAIDGGYVCEVWQSAYGHLARKRTWLFYSGRKVPQELNWSRPDGTHQIGQHDQRGKERNKPTISGKKASATPIEFAHVLLSLARSAQ